MSKDIKLELSNTALMAVLQIALDSAIEQKAQAMGHHEQVSRTLEVPEDGRLTVERAMAIKEITDPIEKYLKSADASLDKIIKIARLLADVMLRQQDEDYTEMTQEQREAMQNDIHEMLNLAKENKDED